ncbi:exonuclease domain-containing protein [Cytobacillus purgationiresistens]|uniref:DNA polymerase-3 subunit epsilon n=1 Tax=Cytobacillus purgationiresistens TaxID=863449 RepID=A0ABU0ADX8_9BACI|nr:exonuclease domain-containing protein [Cytobacillus purgationiresistens]MDQ0268653.1 DNA polymerase-3 subunit epsilon [Cytobacillus purgationiresistens]
MAFEPFFQFVRGIQGKLNNNRFGGLQTHNSQHMAFIRQLQRELIEDDVMSKPIERINAVVFDIETTGFYPDKGDQIISIGAVKIIDGEMAEDETFYSLVQYEGELSEEIEALTGINGSDLVDAPSLSDVLVEFFQFVKESPLIAHHSSHEKRFMQHASWSIFRTSFKHRLFDTSFLYRLIEPQGISIKLEDFCEKNDIQIVDRHHALGDAKLTAQLWLCYVKKVHALGCQHMKDVYERIAKLP